MLAAVDESESVWQMEEKIQKVSAVAQRQDKRC
jgi:hypothetical protein